MRQKGKNHLFDIPWTSWNPLSVPLRCYARGSLYPTGVLVNFQRLGGVSQRLSEAAALVTVLKVPIRPTVLESCLFVC